MLSAEYGETSVKILNKCPVCKSSSIFLALPLSDTPLEDRYLSRPTTPPVFPLILYICGDCEHLFLRHVVDPGESYSDYLYESSTTVGLALHYKNNAEDIISRFRGSVLSYVLDIGSNDGTMLEAFTQVGLAALGVEPAGQIAEKANSHGRKTINGYFSAETVDSILATRERPSIVTANFMFANVAEPLEFSKLVEFLMQDDGLFVIETGYHPSQFSRNMFDYVYHEHLSYFSVTVLKRLFESCGLRLFSVSENTQKGGSIRAFVCKAKAPGYYQDDSVDNFICLEKNSSISDISYFLDLYSRIVSEKVALLKVLDSERRRGSSIVGFGASHSTTTLIYEFAIAPFLDYIVDDNPIKNGRFSPGFNIPVFPTQKIYDLLPDLIVILAWQHAEIILNSHRALLKSGVKFIVPLPKVIIHG
ncbi:C-methyltransferase [Burkholderiales bacterium]|jgi:hypothetical protein